MCEGCGIKHPTYGLPSEGKRRWCAGCAKARPGKERAFRLGGGRLHAAKAAGIHEQANIQPLEPSGAVEVCQANREKQGREEEEYQEEEDEGEEVCAICLDDLVDHQCYQTACDHQFHVSCMNSWLDTGSACPLCNQRVMRRSLKRVYEHH